MTVPTSQVVTMFDVPTQTRIPVEYLDPDQDGKFAMSVLMAEPAKQPPDAALNVVTVETLVANTNKQIAIPAGCNGVHVDNQIAKSVFFKLDAAFVTVPAGGTYQSGGFFKSSQEVARILSSDPIGNDHTLNLISEGAGAVVVEFFYQ